MIGAYWLNDPPANFVSPGKSSRSATATKVSSVNLTTSQMLKVGSFYPLWIAYMLGCISGTMTISQVVPFARSAGFSATAAAFAITIGAAGSALGRFLSGWLSDHLGRLLTIRVVLVAAFIAAPALYLFRESVLAFYLLLFVVYYAYGTQLSVYTALAGDFYGPKHSAANYGILLLAWGTAGIFGPLIGGQVFTATGSYQMAFYLAAGASLASLLLLTLAKPPMEEPMPTAVGAASADLVTASSHRQRLRSPNGRHSTVYTQSVSSFRRLLVYVRRYRRAFTAGLICSFVTTGITLVAPLVLQHAIDDLTAGVTRRSSRCTARQLLAIGCVGGVFRFWTRRILIGASRDIEYDMRNDFFAHLRDAAARLFPGPSHRRPDVARDQRSERRAHDDRARRSCTRPTRS